MRILLSITFLLLSIAGISQNQKYAFKILEALTAPDMHGRGYIESGDQIAADYIEKQFEQFGIQKFGDSHQQEFTLDVNTFPGKMEVNVDGNTLTPGVDFVVEQHSGGATGEFEPIWINKDNCREQETYESIRENPIFILDPKGIEDKEFQKEFNSLFYMLARNHAVAKINDTKFTWGVGREAFPNAMLEIKREKLPETAKSITLNIEQVMVKDYKSQNVIGFIPGTHKKKKKEYVIICGHYDHLGRMGTDTYFPGANDNASGIAYLLSMMRFYTEHPPEYTMVFIAFGGEEAGLVGSEFYTENPLFPLKKIRFVLNMDIMGTGSEGITVVNSTVQEKEYQILLDINSETDLLPKIKKRGPTQNSDHYHFAKRDIPAFFIYTLGGSPAYHDVEDQFGNIRMEAYESLMKLMIEFVQRL
jgi:aminopeptidase YwaD